MGCPSCMGTPGNTSELSILCTRRMGEHPPWAPAPASLQTLLLSTTQHVPSLLQGLCGASSCEQSSSSQCSQRTSPPPSPSVTPTAETDSSDFSNGTRGHGARRQRLVHGWHAPEAESSWGNTQPQSVHLRSEHKANT